MASTAIAVPSHLAQKGRTELLKHVMNIRQGIQRHKETAKHVGTTLVQAVVASAGGAAAGGLSVKFPHVPKTKVRTDLALGAVVGAATAAGVFDEHAATVGAFAHGLLGFGMGDVVRNKLLASGVKQAA